MSDDWVRGVAFLLTVAFVLQLTVSFYLMALRVVRLRRRRMRVSRILRRDVALFGVFMLAFLPTTIDVALDGEADLSQHALWSLGIRIIAVAVAGYWTWVEIHLESPGGDLDETID